MRSAMEVEELRHCRDPLPDPELARYLSLGEGRKSDECGVGEFPIVALAAMLARVVVYLMCV